MFVYRFDASIMYVLFNLMYVLGTSTDVSRFGGEYEHVFEATTAGVTIQAPQVSQHVLIQYNNNI